MGARFYYFDVILRWKRVCIAHNNCMSCPSIWATLSALLINISSCFCIVDSSLWGWNNPVQRCLPVGGRLHYHAGGGVVASLTDRLLWCATDDDQRRHHRRASFSALASANSLRVFCIERSNITLTHLHVSNCAFSKLSSLAFLSRWALWAIALSPVNS